MKPLLHRRFAPRVVRGRLARQIALCFALGAAAGEVVACALPLTVLHRDATATARIGAGTTFFLQPIDFSALVVGYVPEPHWLAPRSFEQRASWEHDKVALSQRFAARMLGRAGPLRLLPGVAPRAADVAVILPRVTYIEPGVFWTGPELVRDTDVHMTVAIVGFDGRLLEQIALRATVHPGYTRRASIGGRVRVAGDKLADLLLGYLVERCRAP